MKLLQLCNKNNLSNGSALGPGVFLTLMLQKKKKKAHYPKGTIVHSDNKDTLLGYHL